MFQYSGRHLFMSRVLICQEILLVLQVIEESFPRATFIYNSFSNKHKISKLDYRFISISMFRH